MRIQAKPFNQALLYLRPAGTLVAVGMPAGGATLNVPIALLVPKVSGVHLHNFSRSHSLLVYQYCWLSYW